MKLAWPPGLARAIKLVEIISLKKSVRPVPVEPCMPARCTASHSLPLSTPPIISESTVYKRLRTKRAGVSPNN